MPHKNAKVRCKREKVSQEEIDARVERYSRQFEKFGKIYYFDKSKKIS